MTTNRSATLVRRWVALYTRGLPADVRDARREEIAADLWSQAQDAERIDGAAPANDILGRLAFGLWADITWRLEQGRRVRGHSASFRSLPMGTRILAALTIVGGAAVAVGLAIIVALVAAAPDGTLSTLDYSAPQVIASMLVYNGGLVLLSIALWGLVFRFQDRVRGGVAMVGVLGGFGGMLYAIGAYALLLLLLVGSAAVALELSRFGGLPRSMAVVHTVAAVAFFALLVAALMNWPVFANSAVAALVVLALPYPLTWIGIGAALIRGDQTSPAPRVP